MERKAYKKLLEWKNSARRMPLVICGVRQCGKTYLMQQFGEENYDHVAYLDFSENPELGRLFAGRLIPERLIRQLTLITGVPILPGKTLIIFDEVQECKRALTSLKYFYQDAPEYHLMCAGSLLGVHLRSRRPKKGAPSESLPLGKVDFIDMYPLDFEEFLLATGCKRFRDEAMEIPPGEPVPEYISSVLKDSLDAYMVIGGMPAAVEVWAETGDISEVQRIQHSILRFYRGDLDKHPVDNMGTLQKVWDEIPRQLAKDGSRFIFGHAVKGATAERLDQAVRWLENAGMAYRIFQIDKPSIPMSMYEEGFYKLYMSDIGLFRLLSGAPTSFLNTPPEQYKDFKGAIAENMVLQQMMLQLPFAPCYWRSGATAEVDFVAPLFYEPVPIEVKSGSAKSSKSLKVYREKYSPRVAVKTSMDPDVSVGPVVHIPLYLVWRLPEFVHAALTATGWTDPDEDFESRHRPLSLDPEEDPGPESDA